MDSKQKDVHRKSLGKKGEDLACAFLQQQGLRILSRNFHGGHKEIDIVCTDGSNVRFVEVKTRQESVQADPASAVDQRKQRLLVSAAGDYLSSEDFKSSGLAGADELFFDIVSIVWNEDGTDYTLEYIPQAFIPLYT